MGQETKHVVMVTLMEQGPGCAGDGAGAQARTASASGLFSCAGISAGSWHGSLSTASSTGCLWRLCRMPTPMAASR